MLKDLYEPCLATFIYALPFAYRDVNAEEGTTLQIVVDDDVKEIGKWYLQRSHTRWHLLRNVPTKGFTTSITIPADIAWRFFTKALPAHHAEVASVISGDRELVATIFKTVSVMA